MSGLARETAAAFGQSITLDQAALFAEFQDDDTAVTQIMNDICNGRTGQHVAERLRQERADEAARQQLITQLAADGYEITDEYPGARLLFAALCALDLAHQKAPGRVLGDTLEVARGMFYVAAAATDGHRHRVPESGDVIRGNIVWPGSPRTGTYTSWLPIVFESVDEVTDGY